MELSTKELSDYNAKDWLYYVMSKLRERGIDYKVKYPADIIFVGRLAKTLRKRGKTNYSIKQTIDDLFNNFDITTVQSLKFLQVLSKKTKEEEEQDKLKKLHDPDDFVLSDTLKAKLEGLK